MHFLLNVLDIAYKKNHSICGCLENFSKSRSKKKSLIGESVNTEPLLGGCPLLIFTKYRKFRVFLVIAVWCNNPIRSPWWWKLTDFKFEKFSDIFKIQSFSNKLMQHTRWHWSKHLNMKTPCRMTPGQDLNPIPSCCKAANCNTVQPKLGDHHR